MKTRAALVLGWATCLAALPNASQADEPLTLKVALHLHSTISMGELAPQQIIELAARAGLDAVVLTESARRRWEYGVWPIRPLLRRVLEQPSVFTFGVERYLDTVRRLNHGPSGVITIAGLEVAPFYYWQRSPFDRRGGQIRNWHQHLLVLGLEDPRAIRQLPLSEFDPYHGSQGARPSQQLIDAVNAEGGLVFWAHPAASHVEHYGSVEEFTEPYSYQLELTTNYHGFAVADENALPLVEPGAVWDRLLLSYCRGQRARPVWIVGELDWRGPQRPLDAVVTQVMAAERSPQAILAAFRAGKMWVVVRTRSVAPTLSRVTLTDIASGQSATMGERITSTGPVRLHLSGGRGDVLTNPARVIVVKDGQVFASQEVREPRLELQWTDASPTHAGFYRVIIQDASGLIYTNPIFVNPALSSSSP